MKIRTRRELLGDFGRGMLFLGVGPSLLPGLELDFADEDDRLDFGALEPLVARIQETPADELLGVLVRELRGGTELRRLVAAGALANARTFGGENYNGYHAFMALIPALEMAELSPEPARALPVLKVLHRNARFIADAGGREHEVLRKIGTDAAATDALDGTALRDAVRAADKDAAERTFADLCARGPESAYEELQLTVQDDLDVHRIVLAWRVRDMLRIAGAEHAHTLLRQSVRHCVDVEVRRQRHGHATPSLRELLPALLEEHRLGERAGTQRPDDARIEELAGTIFRSGRDDAAKAMAHALSEGFAPADLGESLSLAANALLLHDGGLKEAQPGKPVGSVHGATVGLHASDAARAWRGIAALVGPRNAAASLIAGAYHTAGQSQYVGAERFPWGRELDELADTAPAELVRQLGPAIEARDQARACALVERCGQLDADARPVFDVLLGYGTSEDGALHAEKYFSTVHQEFAEGRPAFRWRHLIGLARVTASEHGFPAPGVAEARALLQA